MNSLLKTGAEKEPNKTIRIIIASTIEEKIEIYRLRYLIYVEEMSRRLELIDHETKLLYDEMDDWGILIYAQIGIEIIGTMRVNVGKLDDFPRELVQILSLDKFQKFDTRQNFALSTKLMVSPNYRSSQALYLLLAKGYEIYCNHQVQFSFGGCNFFLIRLYEQLGFHRFGRNFIDPGYGLLTPIVLLVDGIDHLRAVRSPYLRIARKRESFNSQVVNWFSREFPDCLTVVNSQLFNEEMLWAYLCSRLESLPQKSIPVANVLSEEEARKLFHCGVVVQCHAGDQIITCGDTSNELNILISGTLTTNGSPNRSANTINHGQHFGTIGLYDQSKYTEDAIATTQSEIFVLSRQSFQKFSHNNPDTANKFLQHLTTFVDDNKHQGGEPNEQ